MNVLVFISVDSCGICGKCNGLKKLWAKLLSYLC